MTNSILIGEPWVGSANPYEQYYAGFPRYDADLGLDPASFRDYNPAEGRWLSPDPDNAGANPSNPQSWDAYSYAGNNPTTNTDPTGLYCVKNNNGNLVDEGSGGESCADGQKIVRVDTNAARPHYNFENKITGGNLHVYF